MNPSASIRSAFLALVLLAGIAPLAAQTPAAPVKAKARRTKADKSVIAEKYNRFMDQGLLARLAATPVSVEGRYLALWDAQSKLPADTLEAVRMRLQQCLETPVRLAPLPAADNFFAAGLDAMGKDATNIFAAVLLVAQPAGQMPALSVSADDRLIIINVVPLAPSDQLPLRIEKQTLRGVGLVYGLALAGDPFSVMRHLDKGIADLDTFSRSFAPDESLRFKQNAEARGFPLRINTIYLDKVVQGLMPPINPARWPAWEKIHKKSVAETFKKYGFNPDEIAAEYKRLIREGLADPEDAAEAKAKP
jgi:hypothetical protein